MPIAGPVGLIGLVIAVARPATRSIAVVSTTAIVSYAVVFLGGADMHDYWNYALLLPLAVGAASLAEWVIGAIDTERRRVATSAVLGLAALAVLMSLARPSSAEDVLRNGTGTGRLAHVADARSDGRGPALAYVSGGGALSRWIDYETGRPGLALADTSALQRLARRRPTFPVLVVLARRPDRQIAHLEAGAFAVSGPYALVPAALAANP